MPLVLLVSYGALTKSTKQLTYNYGEEIWLVNTGVIFVLKVPNYAHMLLTQF